MPKGIWMWAECTMLTMLIAAWNGIFAARKSSSSSAASLGPGRHQPRGRLSAQEGGTRGSGLDAQIFPPPSPHPDPGGAHLGTAPPRPKASPDLAGPRAVRIPPSGRSHCERSVSTGDVKSEAANETLLGLEMEL